jgi:hypothetical protein
MKVNRDRWKEEEVLLEEEITRTECYFRHFSEHLMEQSRQNHAGMAAYLARMAATYHMLAEDVTVCYNRIQ